MDSAVRPKLGGLTWDKLAEIAVGTTTRVDLCRLTTPEHLGRLVAIKRLLPEASVDPQVESRFLDEVWMTSALHHPNVVGVVGWGKDDSGSYLAEELVQGVSLARLIKIMSETGEEFSERLAVFVVVCIARGLIAAHELVNDRGEPLGLVHRDLSAQNVLVGFNGDIKVADFGLARAKDRLTHTTSSLPTRSVAHLSPEELRGERLDHRADLFSVGVILFELLTKQPPFRGKDELQTIQLALTSPPPDPLTLRPRLDKALGVFALRALEKDQKRRFQTAREMVHELEAWMSAHGYREESQEALARFVRRSTMRQIRWFERAIAGQLPMTTSLDGNLVGPPPRIDARKTTTSGESQPPKRRDEATVVESRRSRSAPPPRRSRSESFGAVREPNESGPPPSDPSRELPNFIIDNDDSEDIPTIAIRRSDHPILRQLAAEKAALEALANASATPPPPPPPSAAPPAMPSTSPAAVTLSPASERSVTPSSLTPSGMRAPSAPPPLPPRVRSSPPSSSSHRPPPPPRVDELPHVPPPPPVVNSEMLMRELTRIVEICAKRVEHSRKAEEAVEDARAAADIARRERARAERAVLLARAAVDLVGTNPAGAMAKLDEALSNIVERS